MYSDGALKRLVAESLEERSAGLPAGSLLFCYQAVGNTRTDLSPIRLWTSISRMMFRGESGLTTIHT